MKNNSVSTSLSAFRTTLFDMFRKTFCYKGRASTWDYTCLGIVIALFAVGWHLALLFPFYDSKAWQIGMLSWDVLNTLLLVPLAACGVRRAHDIGKPAWYYFLLQYLCPILIYTFIPILGKIAACAFFVHFAYLEGEKKENAYGPVPEIPVSDIWED